MNKIIKIVLFIIYILYSIITTLLYILLSINGDDEVAPKDKILNCIKEYTIPYIVIDNNVNIHFFEQLQYPKVFKPTFITGKGTGVKIINNSNEALNYHNQNIKNNKNKQFFERYIVQDYLEGTELSIMYLRYPLNDSYEINIVERINQKNYIFYSSKSKEYKVRPDLETEELCKKINSIIKQKIPTMYSCRIDVICKDEIKFKNGEDLNIIEVNCACGLDLRWSKHNKNKWYKLTIIDSFVKKISIGIMNILLFQGVSNKNYIKNSLLLCSDVSNLISIV